MSCDLAGRCGGSCGAGASAAIAYVPSLSSIRIPMAVIVFIALTAIVLVEAFTGSGHAAGTVSRSAPHGRPLAMALAFPVAMALATGG